MKISLRGHSINLTNASPYVILLVVFAVIPLFVSTQFWLNIFILVFIKSIAAVSLRTLGLSGNESFAHSAFLAIGAYTAALLANNLGVPPYLTIPAGAVMSMVIGVLTGLPFVRLRSIYYLMASMFLCVAIIYFIAAMKITGGLNGLPFVPGLFSGIKTYYYFFYAMCIGSCLLMYRFEFSRIGVTLRAIAQSPAAATAMGVNEGFYKLLAVAVGCFFVGLAGGAYAHYNSMLSPTSFGMLAAIWMMMYVMVGGRDKFIGPILGAILLVIIPEASRAMSQYAPFVTAGAMIIVAYLLPGGLVSIPSLIMNFIEKRRERHIPAGAGGEI